MRKQQCININNNTKYYLISKYVVDSDGTGFDYLLTPYYDEGAEYMVCSNTYFDNNFKLYNTDYKKIKSPAAGNEEILKQCSSFTCYGYCLINNLDGFFCIGHGHRTWDLDIYKDCEFEAGTIYTVTVHPETGKVVDIYE